MRDILTICLVTLLFAVTAMAETYVWEDANGTVNFSEDISRVPKKYRKKVRVRGDLSSPAPEQPSAVEPGASKPSTPVPVIPDAGKSVGRNDKKELRYGGKSGDEWRSEFAYLKADLKSTDDQIAELNGRLADTSQMSHADYLNTQSSLKSLQLHKTEVGRRLDALSLAATKAGVPAEFR
jgi:hypothetical protein